MAGSGSDHHVNRLAQGAVGGAQHPAKERGLPVEPAGHGAQDRTGPPVEVGVPGQQGQAQEHVGGDRVARRRGGVEHRPGTCDEAVMLVRGVPERARRAVPELPERHSP